MKKKKKPEWKLLKPADLLARKKELGAKGTEMAKLFGVSVSTFGNWIHGRSVPSMRMQTKIVQAVKKQKNAAPKNAGPKKAPAATVATPPVVLSDPTELAVEHLRQGVRGETDLLIAAHTALHLLSS